MTTEPIGRTLAADLAGTEPGRRVTIQGHVHRRRELASVSFLIVRDRTGLAQVVAPAGTTLPPEETVIAVSGVATPSRHAPGGIEVADPEITLLTDPAELSPVPVWRPTIGVGLSMMLDAAPVALRHELLRSRWELAAASLRGFRTTLDAAGFTEIQTPKIVASATESGANVFELDYFGRTAYLAQSPQFYKQQLVGVFERVYETGPVFRAEPHDTARHLSEYVSLDVEFGFIRDHRDVLALLRDVLTGMVAAVRTDASGAVGRLGVRLPVIPVEIPILHFADALTLVGAPVGEPDLAPHHERALGEWAWTEHGSDVVAIEGYPMRKRPFYTHPWTGSTHCDDGEWSNSFDVLFRGLELVTGGQRLHRPTDYEAAIRTRGGDASAYATYLQAFRYGMPPHGGFAVGLERWVARLVEAANIREVALFPRDLHRLTP